MLTHSQTDHVMPQLGLSLAQCVEMPSITDYIFENAVETDAQGYLTPRLGLCWQQAWDWPTRRKRKRLVSLRKAKKDRWIK